MRRQRTYTQATWDRFVDSVDGRIDQAVSAQIAVRALRAADFAAAYNELSKFWTSGGEDPDYNVKGVGPAYLLRYAARTISHVAIGLQCLALRPGARILDVGSGASDATALAIDLLAPGLGIELTTCEPSAEMAGVADFVQVADANVHRVRSRSTLDEILNGVPGAPQGPFDVIVLSASLPSGFLAGASQAHAAALGRRVRDLVAAGGTVASIEPGGRAFVQRRFLHAARLAGFSVNTARTAEVAPRGVTLGRRLNRSTARLIELVPAILRAGGLTTTAIEGLVDPRTSAPWPVLAWTAAVDASFAFATPSRLIAPSSVRPEAARNAEATVQPVLQAQG